MKILIFVAIVLAPVTALIAQDAPARPPAAAPPARHLVMFTRAGPNFGELQNHMAEARVHQAPYERLAANRYTIASGAFEGQPILGMTIWAEGIDEGQARELIKGDDLPNLGIVEYEFRAFGVRSGSLRKDS